MPFIPTEVFTDRQRRIREYLAEHEYHALLVSDPDHFYMSTGFHLDVAPWERPVAAVIPVEGQPFLIMNELSTHHLMMARERGTLHVPDYAICATRFPKDRVEVRVWSLSGPALKRATGSSTLSWCG